MKKFLILLAAIVCVQACEPAWAFKVGGMNWVTTDGTVNQCMKTDGATNLGWMSVAAASGGTITNVTLAGSTALPGGGYISTLGWIGIGKTPTVQLDVSGAAKVSGNITISGSNATTGNETVGGNVTITGSLAVTGNSAVTGRSTVGGNLTVTGSTATTGNETVSGTQTVAGLVTMGSATTGGIQANTSNISGPYFVWNYLSGLAKMYLGLSDGSTLDSAAAAGDSVLRFAQKLYLSPGGANTHTIIDSSGNVGIGKTPTAVLDVSGAALVASTLGVGNSANRGIVTVTGTSAADPFVYFDDTNAASGRKYGLTSGNQNAGWFTLYDITSNKVRFSIDTNGAFTLGTSTSFGAETIVSDSSNSAYLQLDSSNLSGGHAYKLVAGDAAASTFSLRDVTASAYRLNVDSSGNIQFPHYTTAGPLYVDGSGNMSSEAALAISRGGTGQATANAGFNALSPMTTLGDVIYGAASGVATRLAGNITAVKQYLCQTGTGSVSAAPGWCQVAFTDLSGSVAATQLPTPTTTTLGGVKAYTAVTNQFLISLGTNGSLASAQPAFTDISGSVAATQLPNPSASTLGGIRSYVAVASQWINTISTSGVPSSAQPAFTDISGVATAAQTPAFTGDVTKPSGSAVTTVASINGVAVSGTAPNLTLSGSLGIGKTPTVQLDVSGAAKVSGAVTLSGSLAVTGISQLIGNLGIGAAPSTQSMLQGTSPTAVTGTLTNSAAGTAVTCATTCLFLTEFHIGDTITMNSETQTINAIASDAAMTTTAWTGANTGATATRSATADFFVFPNGNIQIGGSRTTVTNIASSNPLLNLVTVAASTGATSTPSTQMQLITYSGSTASGSPSLILGHSKGTEASEVVNGSGDILGNVLYRGYSTGTGLSTGAVIKATTTEAWNATSRGTKIDFQVTANTTTTNSTALTLGNDKAATFTGNVTTQADLQASTLSTSGITCLAGTAATGCVYFPVNPDLPSLRFLQTNGTAKTYFGVSDGSGLDSSAALGDTVLRYEQALWLSNAGANALKLDSSGNATFLAHITANGLGTVTPGTNGAVCASSTGAIGANTANCIVSLLEFKESISKMNGPEALATVTGLADAAIYYQYTDQYLGKDRNQSHMKDFQPGFGAEWVEKIDPRYALYDSTGKLHGVRYEQMAATEAVAIKELKTELDAAKSDIAILKAALVTLQAQVTDLRGHIK